MPVASSVVTLAMPSAENLAAASRATAAHEAP